MKPGRQIVDGLMNEVILYGGIPMRRCDVYRDALEATGSHKAADMFAFGLRARAVDAKPWSLDTFRRLVRDSEQKVAV